MKKNKGFNPFDFTMKHGKLTIGTIGVMGLASKMPSSPSSSRIVSGMDTLKIIPTTHAVSGVFGSFTNLEKIIKKRR